MLRPNVVRLILASTVTVSEQSKLLLHTLEDGAGDQPEKKEEISVEQAVIQAGSPKCYCESTGRAKSRCVEM